MGYNLDCSSMLRYFQQILFRLLFLGTREEKTKKDNEVPWYKILWEKISKICTCCRPAPAPQPTAPSSVDGRPTESSGTTSPEVGTTDRRQMRVTVDFDSRRYGICATKLSISTGELPPDLVEHKMTA